MPLEAMASGGAAQSLSDLIHKELMVRLMALLVFACILTTANCSTHGADRWQSCVVMCEELDLDADKTPFSVMYA